MSDFRAALRALRKSPAFTLVAIVTIAVGIGANTTLFSVYDRLVLNPVTIPHPSSLVAIWTNNPQLNFNAPALSWPRYEDLRDHAQSFSSIGISAFDNFTLTGNGDPEQLNGQRVSATFFPTLGILPARGRNFTADEDVPNGPAVCIISHELWQTRFGGRASIVGENITLNGQPWQVVGIMPPRLSPPFGQVQVFAPRVFEVGGLTPVQIQAGAGYAQPIARLKPGVSLEAGGRASWPRSAAATSEQFASRLDANNTSEPRLFVAALVGNLEPTFYTLHRRGQLRAADRVRQRRVAVPRTADRAAQGDCRAAVARRDARAGRPAVPDREPRLLARRRRARRAGRPLVAVGDSVDHRRRSCRRTRSLTLNWRALAFTGGVTLISALLVGLVPALQASKARLVDVLKDSARGSSSERGGRFRATLIVGEVALSVVLLVGSSLLLMSFLKLQRTPPGFEPTGAAAAFVGVPLTRYKTPRAAGRVLRPGHRAAARDSRGHRRGGRDRAAAGRQPAVAVQRRRAARPAAARSGRSPASPSSARTTSG